MQLLSQTAGYAIVALSFLYGRDDEWVLARDIADATGIPRPYLSRILHLLGKSGLILTKLGYRGGVSLSRPPEKITLLEVAKAIDATISRPVFSAIMANFALPCPAAWFKNRALGERRAPCQSQPVFFDMRGTTSHPPFAWQHSKTWTVSLEPTRCRPAVTSWHSRRFHLLSTRRARRDRPPRSAVSSACRQASASAGSARSARMIISFVETRAWGLPARARTWRPRAVR